MYPVIKEVLSTQTEDENDIEVRIEKLLDRGQPVSLTGVSQFSPENYLGLRRKAEDGQEEEPFALYDTTDDEVSLSRSMIPCATLPNNGYSRIFFPNFVDRKLTLFSPFSGLLLQCSDLGATITLPKELGQGDLELCFFEETVDAACNNMKRTLQRCKNALQNQQVKGCMMVSCGARGPTNFFSARNPMYDPRTFHELFPTTPLIG